MKNHPVNRIKILYGLEAAEAGALKHVAYLINNLDTTLFEITVIISTQRSKNGIREIPKMQASGARVLIIPMEREIKLWNDFISFIKIYFHLRKNNYHVIHAHSSKAGILFRIAGWLSNKSKLVYTPHCFYFQSQSGIKKKIYIWIERIMCKITKRIIVSNAEKIAALNFSIGNPKKFININNAIDFNEYNFSYEIEKVKKEMGINKQSVVVGSIGRLVEQKDWITYIYAAKDTTERFPNVIFLIVGEGELSKDLHETIQNIGLKNKIIITGYLYEISKIYTIIDIYVSTSLWEGLPYVLLEAMWFKKPIVATNLSYNNLIIDEENGYLVAIRDYKHLAKKIQKLIKDKSLIVRMGENGYSLVKANYSFEKFVMEHQELYQAIL